MVRPVPVFVCMRRASRGKLLHRMSMLAIDMIGMVVSMPPVFGIEVRYQQALAMMPACAKDIIIFLTLRRAFFLAQAIPFAMGMFLNSPGYYRRGNRAITRRLEEEAEVNIHQAIKTEFLVNPANFRQQLSPESHQVGLNRIDIWPRRFTELA